MPGAVVGDNDGNGVGADVRRARGPCEDAGAGINGRTGGCSAADDDRRAGEAVTPGAGHAAFFADELHAQLGVIEFPLDFAVPGVETVKGASAALREHLATVNDRCAAWPARALAILENRCQPRGPLFRAVGSREGDHGFLPTAIFEMEHRATGDDRRRQSLARFDFPNHLGLIGQLG